MGNVQGRLVSMIFNTYTLTEAGENALKAHTSIIFTSITGNCSKSFLG